MSAWKDLPTEILNLIFTLVSPDYDYDEDKTYKLEQCQLTCKNWSELAQKRLYKSISIGDVNVFGELLATLCTAKSDPGRHVKEVSIDPWDEIVSNPGFLQLLLLKCPNIVNLRASPAVNGDFYKEIRKAYSRGACKSLDDVPPFSQNSTKAGIKQYYSTLYCLRNSIQHIVLDQDFVVNSNITTNKLLQNMKNFKDLRWLTLRMNSVETAYKIGQYIEGCPNFITLHLSWYTTGIDTNEDMIVDIHSTTRCPNVIQIQFLQIPLTKKMLEYIMYAFPNIKRFTLTAQSVFEDPRDITTKISNDLWLQFFNYINRARQEMFANFLYMSDIPGVLANLFTTTKFDRYLSIVYLKNTNDFTPYVNISSRLSSLDRQIRNPPTRGFFATAVYQAIERRYVLPFMGLLCRVGGFLKSLRFDTSSYPTASFPTSNLTGVFLDAICRECPSLVELSISSLIISNCLEPQTNTSIKQLNMLQCGLSLEMFPELSVRFPSLSNFWLNDHFQVDANGKPQDIHKYIIEMPNTSFDTVTWSRNYPFDKKNYTEFNLKVVTSTTSYYYFGEKNGNVTQSSDILFQKRDIQSALSLYIQCRNIKTLKVRLRYWSWTINFTEM